MKPSLLLALPVLAAAGPLDEPLNELQKRGCDADNCLRAVRATKLFESHSADCLSYFLVTVTPATSTITNTFSFSTTPTVTVDVTTTTTIPGTVTTTIDETFVSTSAVAVTATQYITLGMAISQAGDTLYKRQLIETPTAIPEYATACLGSVRYSSACSCIGAVASTVTAATPLTTVTVSTTSTAPPSIVVTTVATASIIVVEATDSVTTTVATVTSPVVVTTTVTSVVPSATAVWRLWGSYDNYCMPGGGQAITWAVPEEALDYDDLFWWCAPLCDEIAACHQIWIAYTYPGNYECYLGTGVANQEGWDDDSLQCNLPAQAADEFGVWWRQYIE